MRKTVLACSLMFLASVASAQSRTVVSTTGNSATLSAAIRVGDMLYMSGQLPNLRGPAADTTIEGQTKSALDKIKAIADSAGTKMDNVVKCTVFLVNFADFNGMNTAYKAFWPKDPPARSTVVVAALVSPGAKLEVECLATYVK